MKNFLIGTRAAGTPAGFLQRFLAWMLDSFIIIAVSAPVPLLFGGDNPLALLVALSIQVGYLTFSHSSRQQATPGKHIMHIHVTNALGERLSLRRAFERALAFLLPFMPQITSLPDQTAGMIALWLALAWFMPIFYTSRRTGVHDMLCGTRVVSGRVGS